MAGLDLADAIGAPATGSTSPNGGADGDVVLRAGGVPVVTAVERDGRRIVTLNLNLRTATLPLSTAFPVLIANAVDWLAARDRHLSEVTPGEPWRATVRDPGALGAATILGPGGERLPFLVSGRDITFTSTEAAGVYRWRGPDGERAFVVNAATDSESDLAGPDVAPSPAADVAPSLAADVGPSSATDVAVASVRGRSGSGSTSVLAPGRSETRAAPVSRGCSRGGVPSSTKISGP